MKYTVIDLAQLVTKAILLLENIGAQVLELTSDGALRINQCVKF